ncbi:undecaprenyl/decaprenyl-phosphate alpha-N-acetylglucosaminyl 1-phosphate transferase [Patescibacteria group bacterium AH-259-L05]|nr:undecaprenyl/decaprenyl-phosphate alpha-N-acetylglucosaminyl 1-phosphate transferase [Patescibacteria group bacterium AH-259-L05]
MIYILFFIASFILSIFITFVVKTLALKLKILDWPEVGGRKIHKKPVPLLGGLAIFITFFVILFVIYLTPLWPEGAVKLKHLIGLLLGGIVIMVGGFLDDKYQLKPYYQIIWPIIAVIIIGVSGMGIEYVNNPIGEGYVHLDTYKIEVIRLSGIPYYFTPLADIVTFVWLMLVMYATKLLDGLDGLVSGITFLGALSIAGLSFLTIFFQPDVGLMALLFAGAVLGFLLFNFHPAKIFLGEGGSLFAGFMLGALAIISGGKLATTFLIVGLAVFDLFGVVVRRVIISHGSAFLPDRAHLHFRLLEVGLSHKKAVLLYWIIAVLFGIAALFLRTTGKIVALAILLALSVILIGFLPAKKAQIDKRGVS